MMAKLSEYEVNQVIKSWFNKWKKSFLDKHPFPAFRTAILRKIELHIAKEHYVTESDMALIIDEVYFESKDKFKGTHRLGFAKEDLKTEIALLNAIRNIVEKKDKKLEELI